MQTITLHNEFRNTYSSFSNLIVELVIELKKYIRDMVSQNINTLNLTNSISQKDIPDIESIFYKISKMTLKTDEIVQNIGGLEFSTPEIIHQFTKVLKLIEYQYNRVIGSYSKINYNFQNSSYFDDYGLDLKQDLLQLELEFSLLQEEIQNSLPKVNLLFDELNNEEYNATKFNKTNQF